jgi:hypothetical protein
MTVETSKLVGYVQIADNGTLATSKLVAYAILEPGTEAGATPPVHHAFTYGQRFRLPGQ